MFQLADRSQTGPRRFLILVAAAFMLLPAACGQAASEPEPEAGAAVTADTTAVAGPPADLPAELHDGFNAFTAYCSECHGEGALGTETGPPLIHIYYEPNHHGDASFVSAATMGVVQHHWNFGNMPPVEGISGDEVQSVIGYVRFLQQEAGIY
jgi:cytochrome c5